MDDELHCNMEGMGAMEAQLCGIKGRLSHEDLEILGMMYCRIFDL